jgi:hypothetical protein
VETAPETDGLIGTQEAKVELWKHKMVKRDQVIRRHANKAFLNHLLNFSVELLQKLARMFIWIARMHQTHRTHVGIGRRIVDLSPADLIVAPLDQTDPMPVHIGLTLAPHPLGVE